MSAALVYVHAAGLACPIGLTWPSAGAAMRAGITRKSTSAYRDNQGREIVASYLRDLLPEDASYEERWLFLLTQALRDATCSSGAAALARMRMFLALPRAGNGSAYSPTFVASALSTRLGVELSPDDIHILTEGAHGGYAALYKGCACVHAGQPCVVAAADSLLSAQRLLLLSGKERLLVDGNSDGLIPGEAAAALILGAESHRPLAHIRGIGFAREQSLIDNDIPLRADGLIAAVRAALADAGLQLHELDFRLSDAAGESFYFKEQALLVTRLLHERKPDFPLWLPAETLGDTGAAAGLCSLLWAMAAWQRGYAPGPRTLACAGNEDGARAVVILESVR